MTVMVDLHEETQHVRATLRRLIAELDDITQDLKEEVEARRREDDDDDPP